MTDAPTRRGSGAPAIAIATVILLETLTARLLLAADESRVYLLGRPLNWACALQSRFGLPCPTCGLTRSMVLTLHGEVRRAWSVAPGGPVAALGLLGFAVALLVLALLQIRIPKASTSAGFWIRKGTLAYGGIAAVIWLGGWALQFSEALRSRW
jgi:hypothetical protein